MIKQQENQEKKYNGNTNMEKLYLTEIDTIERELSKLPEGHLSRKGSYYYQTIGTNQKGITKDPSKVRQLAHKAYLLHRLGHLEWNLSLTRKMSQRFKTENPDEIIRELPSFYQSFPTYYFFHPSVHEQLEKISVGSTSHTEGLIFSTYSGIRVRSKSERTIADALDRKGIPYRYEAAVLLGSELRCPDFTVFRPSDGKKYLWEHFGRLDNDEYRQNTIKKLALYARFGYLPFDNLICTYEQDLQNVSYVYEMIDLFLLHH